MTEPYRTIPLPERKDPTPGYLPDGDFCYLCGKKLRSKFVHQIHVVDGGGYLLHLADEELYNATPGTQSSDLGGWLLGPDCAKQIPAEYRTKQLRVRPNDHAQ